MNWYKLSWGVLKFSAVIRSNAAAANKPTTAGRNPAKTGFYRRMFLVFQKELADGQHQDKRRKYYGKGCRNAPQYAYCLREAGINDGCISDVGSRVDADRAGSHLTDGYNVGKLGRTYPIVSGNYFTLNHGKHGISASESE